MSSKRDRLIRDFVTDRAESIEKETGKSATPEQLKAAHDEADGRVDNYLQGWSRSS
jgi:hypothetical protein